MGYMWKLVLIRALLVPAWQEKCIQIQQYVYSLNVTFNLTFNPLGATFDLTFNRPRFSVHMREPQQFYVLLCII